MTRPLLALAPALLALAGCANSGPAQRWIGDLTAPNPANCPPTRGVLLLRAGQATFAPTEGTWVLLGFVDDDGTIEADRSRRVSNTATYETKLTARRTDAAVTGTYTTPRCTYRVDLTRQ
ncbi:MAG: hypothetical protein NVSMB18_27710 [Acetobacteraceae bacterium]